MPIWTDPEKMRAHLAAQGDHRLDCLARWLLANPGAAAPMWKRWGQRRSHSYKGPGFLRDMERRMAKCKAEAST